MKMDRDAFLKRIKDKVKTAQGEMEEDTHGSLKMNHPHGGARPAGSRDGEADEDYMTSPAPKGDAVDKVDDDGVTGTPAVKAALSKAREALDEALRHCGD